MSHDHRATMSYDIQLFRDVVRSSLAYDSYDIVTISYDDLHDVLRSSQAYDSYDIVATSYDDHHNVVGKSLQLGLYRPVKMTGLYRPVSDLYGPVQGQACQISRQACPCTGPYRPFETHSSPYRDVPINLTGCKYYTFVRAGIFL